MIRSAVINDTYTCYEDTMCFFSDKILLVDDVEFAEEFYFEWLQIGYTCHLATIRYGSEYSCAVTPQIRQTGNRLSGLAGTAYASLLA